ncbi:MAG: fibronectin type III domain-containing protein [Planctomycetes bacterium]|nr:fibronectin type III domain-containing protein [Planctomycetota bacterium]
MMNSSHVRIRRGVLLACTLLAPGVEAQQLYGDSCSTLSRGHVVCSRNNDAETWKGGTLPKSSRIYISVGNSSPSTISGFSLYLRSRSNQTEYCKAFIYSSSNGAATGIPDKLLAAGLMVVTPTLGWCRARVCPEVSLPAGYYFIAYDNPSTSLASSIAQNGVLSRYYYKPTNGSLQGPLQDRFMRRMLCDGACPTMTASRPRIRVNWTVETLGPPNSIAVLMLGASGTKIGGRDLPIPLFIINRPDCNLWTSMDIVLPGVRTTSIGKGTVSLPIDDPSLKDKVIHGQWFIFDAFGGKLAYSVSPGWRDKFLQTAPAAPSGVAVSNVGLTTATVTWRDNSDDEAGFHVLASSDGVNYRLAGQKAPNQTSASISGLTKGATNWVKVRAHNESGSNDSAAVSFGTKDDPPAPPSGLRLVARTAHQLDVAWNDDSHNEKGFYVGLSTTGSNFTRVATTGANATSQRISSLTPATKYWIRLRSFNDFGTSADRILTATTLDVPPAAPSNVSASQIGTTTATVAWRDNSNNEAGFHVLASSDGVHYTLAGVRAPNQTQLAISGLAKQATNWVKVRAHNAAGYTDSGAISFVTKGDPPAAPSNLRLVARRSRQFDIAWNDNSNNEDGFHVGYSTDGTNFTRHGSTGVGGTTWTITGLAPATKYWIRVRAFNTYGTSTVVIITATTLNSPPTAPSNIVFSEIGTDRLRITFRDNSNNEDGFRIESKRTDITSASWIVRANLPANDYDTRITGLKSNKPYEFRVIAFNNGGETKSASAFVRTK